MRPGQDFRIGQILEVNLLAGKIILQDLNQGIVQVSTHLWDPLVAIPRVGESWYARREGVDWLLDKRVENSQTTPITSLNAGDRRLETDQHLYLTASGISIHTSPTLSGTGILVSYNNGAVTTQEVTVGVLDSGGTGFRVLRVPN